MKDFMILHKETYMTWPSDTASKGEVGMTHQHFCREHCHEVGNAPLVTLAVGSNMLWLLLETLQLKAIPRDVKRGKQTKYRLRNPLHD